MEQIYVITETYLDEDQIGSRVYLIKTREEALEKVRQLHDDNLMALEDFITDYESQDDNYHYTINDNYNCELNFEMSFDSDDILGSPTVKVETCLMDLPK